MRRRAGLSTPAVSTAPLTRQDLDSESDLDSDSDSGAATGTAIDGTGWTGNGVGKGVSRAERRGGAGWLPVAAAGLGADTRLDRLTTAEGLGGRVLTRKGPSCVDGCWRGAEWADATGGCALSLVDLEAEDLQSSGRILIQKGKPE